MKRKQSEISITFYLTGMFGAKVDLDEITNKLHIIPCKARTPKDWPAAIKNSINKLLMN